jgi:hypothetical protein
MITHSVPAGELKPGMRLILPGTVQQSFRMVHSVRAAACGIDYVEILHGKADHPGDLDYSFVHSTAIVRAASL